MRPCSYQCTSEPQTPTEVTSTSTSRGAGCGTGRHCSAISRGAMSTAARLVTASPASGARGYSPPAPRQPAAGQRAPRDDPDAVLQTGRQDVGGVDEVDAGRLRGRQAPGG